MRLTLTTAKRVVVDLRWWERHAEPERPSVPISPISHLGFAATETRWQDDAGGCDAAP